MDWTECDAVESNPLKLGGTPVVRGTRMDADGLLINHESGMGVDELHDQFGVDRDMIRAVLAFAAAKHQTLAS